uniref:Uncharacterized protein n=1 Tax=Kalanchoe fedtschenkoi TaxID=63787 RepID=A0A7N0UGI5_KALFE
MVLVQASKLDLPQSPHQILSVNYEPSSRSLALTHSDSSLSLYSSVSPLSPQPPSAPQTPTLIPSPISSSAFLLLQSKSPSDSVFVDDTRPVFVASSPLKAGASLCLSFYAVRKGSQVFSKVRVICKQKDVVFDDKLGAVVFKINHGVAVRLSGSVNVFALYSVSSSRIWVFAMKMVSGEAVKLMKCAVIQCTVPVWSISISCGYLLLGEDNGVRVFALRPLVKRQANELLWGDNKHKLIKGKPAVHVFQMHHGAVRTSNQGADTETGCKKLDNGNDVGADFGACAMTMESSFKYHLEQKSATCSASVKLRSIRVGQESGIFKSFDVVNCPLLNSTNTQMTAAKAISIKALTANKFLMLDSLGNLHLLSMSKLTSQMRQLTQFVKVQKLAVLPGTQTVWSSDGFYTVRMMNLAGIDPADSGSGEHVNEDNPTISGNQVIFTSEKIRDVVALSANAILYLGQGWVSGSPGQFRPGFLSWIGAVYIKIKFSL